MLHSKKNACHGRVCATKQRIWQTKAAHRDRRFFLRKILLRRKQSAYSEQITQNNTRMISADQLHQIERTRRPARIESKCGIYFLLVGTQIVYVGQSEDIDFRIKKHIKEGVKYFEEYMFFECEKQSLDLMEAYFIWLYQPPLNRFLPAAQDKFCVLSTYMKSRNISGVLHRKTLKLVRSLKKFWSVEELDFHFQTR